jgi:hypothetical protein
MLQQEYLQLEKQSKQRPSGYYDSWDGPWGSRPPRPKPLFKLLQEALLSEKDLQMIHTERLQYTQLLYRWVTVIHMIGLLAEICIIPAGIGCSKLLVLQPESQCAIVTPENKAVKEHASIMCSLDLLHGGTMMKTPKVGSR